MTAPNIILMLIDDMGWKDLTCYGSSFYETPNIDRLAKEGTLFTDAYAACPVCSPTRASILTGKYPANIGITDWIDAGNHIHPARGRLVDVPYLKQLPQTEYSLARALKLGGYQTWHIGKWHLGGDGYLPQDHGFDVNVGGAHQGSPGHGGYFSPWSIPPLVNADVPDETYLTDYLTEEAVKLIEHREKRPFFLNFWYYQVHTPLEAKPEKVNKYTQKASKLGLDQKQTFSEDEFYPCEHKKDQKVKRRLLQSDPVYAGMIESLDESVGRILDVIECEGITNDTIIIFTSDNGGLATSEGSPTCNSPLSEGKGWMYEGGTREPLLIRWPGFIEKNTTCSTPVSSPDFYPTILEIVGIEPKSDQHIDGISFLPLLKGEKTLERDAIYWHYPHYGNQGGSPGSSIRCGDYKLIEFFEDDRVELYNLQDDIQETNNLAEVEPIVCKRLHNLLIAWREKVEAKIPQKNPNWHRQTKHL